MTDIAVAAVEAAPLLVAARVVAGDDRTADWYAEQIRENGNSSEEGHSQHHMLDIMHQLKRKHENLEDTMLIAEQIFNSSLQAKRKLRVLRVVYSGFEKKMYEEYGTDQCTCDA